MKLPALALLVQCLAAPTWAAPCAASAESLKAAVVSSVEASLALLAQRGMPAVQSAAAEDLVANVAEVLGQTAQEDLVLLYTRSEAGLCVHLLDASGLRAAAWRPGQTDARLSQLQADWLGALRIGTRSVGRAPEPRLASRSAEPLEDAPAPPDRDPQQVAAELARALMLNDLAALLREADEILIVPTLSIASLPFAALPLDGAQVVDAAAVTVLPSLLSFAGADLTRDRHFSALAFAPGWPQALIVGDPDSSADPDWVLPRLPGARKEAQTVASQLGTLAMIGPEATPKAVLKVLGQPVDLIYFAAHGVASEVDPLNDSFIALSGGRLTAREVQQMTFADMPLVVLSACQTGRGLSHAGGTIGLARAFELAGASAVIASLWNVDDQATQVLMTHLVDELDRHRPAEALQNAMLHGRALWPDDPALWAGFIHFGTVSVFATD